MTLAEPCRSSSCTSDLPVETDRAARRSLARLAKHVARELWENTLGKFARRLRGLRAAGDLLRAPAVRKPHHALAIVRQALAELSRANRLGAIAPGAYRQSRVRFEHRLARLERKGRSTPLDILEADSRAFRQPLSSSKW